MVVLRFTTVSKRLPLTKSKKKSKIFSFCIAVLSIISFYIAALSRVSFYIAVLSRECSNIKRAPFSALTGSMPVPHKIGEAQQRISALIRNGTQVT